MRIHRFLFLCVLASLVLAVAPVSAQSAPPPVLPPLDINELAQSFIVFVLGLVGAFVTSPATNAIVAFLKRYLLKDASASTLALIVAAVLMVLLAVAITLGVEQQFRGAIEVITAILTVLAGISINLNGEARVYASSKRYGALVSMGSYTRD